MIDVNDLRKGVTFVMDGELFRVLEYHHHKPGRGNAVIRTKLRNVRSGSTLDRTFQSGDRVQDVRIETRPVQYLYHDEHLYHFMDLSSYEQVAINTSVLGDAVRYIKEGLELALQMYESEPLDVELPTTVDLEVTQSDVAVRGDTSGSTNKLVTVETGARVSVPLFVNVGDTIRVDTRSGEYLTRV
jgi:elongation factor P